MRGWALSLQGRLRPAAFEELASQRFNPDSVAAEHELAHIEQLQQVQNRPSVSGSSGHWPAPRSADWDSCRVGEWPTPRDGYRSTRCRSPIAALHSLRRRSTSQSSVQALRELHSPCYNFHVVIVTLDDVVRVLMLVIASPIRRREASFTPQVLHPRGQGYCPIAGPELVLFAIVVIVKLLVAFYPDAPYV